MAFSQSNITDVRAIQDGADLLLSWTSSDPAGTIFQVYVAGVLAWHGSDRRCLLPMTHTGVRTQIDVGAVDADEGDTDFSSSLPTPAGNGARVTLTWLGGSYLADDIAGYHIYMGTTAGGAVSYTTPVATIPAYYQGLTSDGYGQGGYGQGGYGHAQTSYTWTSLPLSGGVWNFGVKPFDQAGNEGTAQTAAATITAPPNPPASNSAGKRMTYSYNPVSHVATLSWLAPV